jgi:hypothetical protein
LTPSSAATLIRAARPPNQIEGAPVAEWDAKRYDKVDSLQKWIADKHLANL